MTTLQPSLFTFAEPAPTDRPQTIQERFCAFHEANGWVYAELHRMAQEMAQRGRKRLGIKCLVEALRYEYFRQTTDANSSFKVNNSYVSRYARLLIERDPSLGELIELRELRAA